MLLQIREEAVLNAIYRHQNIYKRNVSNCVFVCLFFLGFLLSVSLSSVCPFSLCVLASLSFGSLIGFLLNCECISAK